MSPPALPIIVADHHTDSRYELGVSSRPFKNFVLPENTPSYQASSTSVRQYNDVIDLDSV
ncbi:hypothetical protein J6590_016910 [Homalodisca vitripennis]|nr:hypothetical protein J6590_016910 [Homalodisca vitripennis]